jgi:hypothetical protein
MQDKAAKAAILIEDQNAVQLGSLRFGLSVFDADIALCRSIGKALRFARYFQCDKAKIRIGKQVLVKLLQKKITTGNTELAAEIEVLQALAAELPESSFEMMKPGQIEKVAFLAENDFNESTHTNTPVPEYDCGLALRLAAEMAIPRPVAALLVQRGLDDSAAAYRFLHPVLYDMYSPFLMKNMAQAVSRLRLAIAAGEKTAIFADSDIDGLTSLTLLDGLLRRAGLPVCHSYPEGGDHYGLSETHVRAFAVQGATLLITVDCGIRDHAAVVLARSLGMDVIVCDHHLPREDGELPQAIVIDPHQAGCAYPFKALAGVAVAFKLGFALMQSYLPFYDRHLVFVRHTRESGLGEVVQLCNGIVQETGSDLCSQEPAAGTIFVDCGDAAGFCSTRGFPPLLICNSSFPDAILTKPLPPTESGVRGGALLQKWLPRSTPC